MRVENTLESEPQTIKIVVAADAGNGKTTLARTIEPLLKEKVIVISAEAGLLSLRGSSVDYVELQRKWDEARGAYVDVPPEGRIAHLAEIFKRLQTPEAMAKYRWVFLDSLTEVNQNMEAVLDKDPEFEGPKNTIKKFGELSKRMMALCKAFRDLPHYNVVMTALVKERTDADGKPFLSINMTGAFADRLPALFDQVLYLGVMPEVGPDGRNLRRLLTQKTDRISFPKDRSGRLDRLEDPSIGQIVQKMRARPLVENISEKAKAAHAASVEQGKEAANA